MKKSRLGQNFLFGAAFLHAIADAAKLEDSDTVVEIGPGPGTLTRVLAARVKSVIAIELDPALFAKLKREFSSHANMNLINGDALRFPYESVGEFKVVANIPYYITTPLIFRLLEFKTSLKSMTLTIQKEVAERVVARPGGKDYGVLSIMVQYLTRPELKFIIPKEEFKPVPKVDSAVVHFDVLPAPSVSVRDEQLFSRVIRTAFAQRRKTLSNSLKSLGPEIKTMLQECGIDPGARPEVLSIHDFAKLTDCLLEAKTEPRD